jgi:Fe2+ transport system protein B
MKHILIFLILLLLSNCSKPKTVLICGDHVCVNKAEAEQYFEENLSIEVKIINQKNNEQIDLVELNLKNNKDKVKQIAISPKKDTSNNLKTLSNDEIKKIKKNIKDKKQKKEIDNKISRKTVKREENNVISKLIEKKDKNQEKNNSFVNKTIINKKINIVDVCTILEKCNIDEISKYLIKEVKKRDFPDITRRQ